LDNLEQEILTLINQDNDPRDKAFLLILYRMHQSLAKNTEATMSTAHEIKRYGESFTLHTDEEERVRNQMRGGWRVVVAGMTLVTILFSVIQFLGWQVISNHIQQNVASDLRLELTVDRLTQVEKELYHYKSLHDSKDGR
jgi:hypothetical protein